MGRVHGVSGWVRLNSYTAPPDNILDYPFLRTELNGTQGTLEIDASRRQPKGLLVHFDGFDSPEVSRALTGKEVWVISSELPDLKSGTFYWHELVGLEVINLQGEILNSFGFAGDRGERRSCGAAQRAELRPARATDTLSDGSGGEAGIAE